MDTYVDIMGYRWGTTVEYWPDRRQFVISAVVTKPGSSKALQSITAISPEQLEDFFVHGATEVFGTSTITPTT